MVRIDGDYHPMNTKERAACGVLCVCMMVSVLSGVALIYLTVIIYIPAQKELASGFGESSVMCTTIEKRKIKGDIEACKWNSCSEWCLSKGGGDCTHLYVSVRSNGSNLVLNDCQDFYAKECKTLDLERIEKRNCKEDHQCTELHKMFKCENGLCWNVTEVFACRFEPEDAEPELNCLKKRNCVELDGMYSCNMGRCSRLNKWTCERRCVGIPIRGKNVILTAGDDIATATCSSAIDVRSGETVWRSDQDEDNDHIFMASCTDMTFEREPSMQMKAWDCINGTRLPKAPLLRDGPFTNHTVLMDVYQKLAPSYKIDPNDAFVPFEDEISVFPQSKLAINIEGCVNTLRDECKAFYDRYGRDGRNDTSPARYPCYYSAHNPDFVVKNFNISRTKTYFLYFFVIPASLFVVSCGILFLCSRILKIDAAGHMVFRCCTNDYTNDDQRSIDDAKDDEMPLDK